MKNIKSILIGGLLALSIVIIPQFTHAAGEMWVDTVTAMDIQLEQVTITDIKLEPYPGTQVYVNATIYYKDASGVKKVLLMPLAKARVLYGMSFSLNGTTVTSVATFLDMKGKKINQLTATRLDRVYSPIYAGPSILGSQWIVKMEYSAQAAEPATTTKVQLSVAEGFVQGVSSTDSTITVGKEGINATIKVSAASKITLNGVTVSLSSLAVGDIVEKAEYDPATGVLVNLIAKR